MIVDWKENISGLTMVQVRDVLRVISDRYALVELRKRVPPEIDLLGLMTAFEERGWIEHLSGPHVRTTISGQAVAMAKKLARFSREVGEALLAKVIGRAVSVNDHTDYAYNVEELAVFGSFLTGVGDLGDLDVAYRLEPRWGSSDELGVEKAFARSHVAFPPPARYGFIDRLGWPSEVVRRRLNISNRVSMHDVDEIVRLGWDYRTVYELRPN